MVLAEDEALRGAVINLLRNAAEAQPAGGGVLLLLRNSRDADGFTWVEIVVADDGPGIPEALVERAFRPFVTSKPEGTGLGLPMALRVAHEHGGTLRLVAPDPSWQLKGAAFCLALPHGSAVAVHGQLPDTGLT
jgi:signal transduction histidine kinase